MIWIEFGRCQRPTAIPDVRCTARSSYVVCAVVNPVANQDADSDGYYLQSILAIMCDGRTYIVEELQVHREFRR